MMLATTKLCSECIEYHEGFRIQDTNTTILNTTYAIELRSSGPDLVASNMLDNI